MRKVSFDFFPYEIPLARPYKWAFGAGTLGRGVLVRCTCEEFMGWGEIAFEPQSREVPRLLANEAGVFAERWNPDLCPPHEIGLQLLEIENLCVRPRIRCGVVNAWLSCIGHAANKRISELFCDGPRSEVAVNGFIGCDDTLTALELCGEYQKLGIEVVKCKGSSDIGADVERLEILRASFPTLGFRIDPNGSWPQGDIASFLDRLGALDLDYVEEPFSVSSYTYERIDSLLGGVPFGLDHWGNNAQDIEALLRCCRPKAVVLKQQVVGGFDKAFEIKSALEQGGYRCVVTCSLETLVGIHLAAELAATLTEEIASGLMLWQYYPATLIPWPDVKNGKITLPLFSGSPNLEALATLHHVAIPPTPQTVTK